MAGRSHAVGCGDHGTRGLILLLTSDQKPLALGAGLVVVAAGLGWLAWRSGLMAKVDTVVLALRAAGPAVFFLAMAVLPAAGFPLMAFALVVGP